MVNFYLPVLVGLCGKKGSGKDEASKILSRIYNYQNVKFAGPLKDMLRALLKAQNVPFDIIERMIEGDLKEVPTVFLGGKTPRYTMQTLGTEWGRVLIDSKLWINAFHNSLRLDDSKIRYACTDVRYQNEGNIIHDLGGLLIRLNRNINNNDFSTHSSETEIDALDVDYEIDNNGTLEDLEKNLIDTMMKAFLTCRFNYRAVV